MDANKKAAAREVKALERSLNAKIALARKRNARNRQIMASALKKASAKFYGRLDHVSKVNLANYKKNKAAITQARAESSSALRSARKSFQTRLVQTVGIIAANARRAKRETERMTGVVQNIKKQNAADRKLIREQLKTMGTDMSAAIAKAVDKGKAQGKAIAQRLNIKLKNTKKYLQVEIAEKLDRAADNVMKIVSGKRHKIADNYLSFKAYAVSASELVSNYVANGKGKNLASIGDMLKSVAALGAVKPSLSAGIGFGRKSIRTIFNGKKVKVKSTVGSINGLVNEYTTVCSQVRSRFPMGVGKYLMNKLEEAMTDRGVLQVDKIQGKKGNFVFVNGRSVGLSSKLSDFATLGVRMSSYSSALAKLTASLKTIPATAKKLLKVPPPQWQGN